MLTIGDAFNHIAHACGFDDAASIDPKLSPAMLVNHAGHFVYGLRPWNFAQRMIGTADLIQGQEWIDPPLGCAEVLSLTRNYSTVWPWPYEMKSTTLDDLAQDRAWFQAVLGAGANANQFYAYRYAPVMERDDLTPSALALRLHIGWTPSASEIAAFSVAFRAKWDEVHGDLDSINDWAIPLPDFAEQLYIAVLREVAKGYELEGGGTVEQRLAAVRQWPSFDVAVRLDAALSNRNAMPRHTAIDMAMRNDRTQREWPIASVVYLP